jgi:membrane protease YdiL (CAAX protease family)
MTDGNQQQSPFVFLGLAFGFSWLFWIAAALTGKDASTLPITVLIALGGIGPMASALILLFVTQDRETRRDYWQRIVQIGRIGPGWYAVILITVPALIGLAVLLDRLLGGVGMTIADRFAAQPPTILPFMIFTLFFGPLPEEIGWRGYGLDRLLARHSALIASLILGAIWTVWHLPLFFIAGTYQHGLGLNTLPFWLYMLDKIPQSIIMTWIYNNNRRSTLSAILLHFMVNFTGELFELSSRAEVALIGLWLAATIIIVLIWGAKTLTRQQPTV